MSFDIQDFQNDVIQRSYDKAVVADFWAEWCQPCRILGPVLEKLAQDFSQKIYLAKINTEQFVKESQEYGIRGIPNVKLFVNGKITAEFTGAIPESAIREWLIKNLPSPNIELFDKAKTAINQGDKANAKRYLEEFIHLEPNSAEAKLCLLKLMIWERDIEKEPIYHELKNHTDFYEEIQAIRTISEFLKLDIKQLEANEINNLVISIQNDLKNEMFEVALKQIIRLVSEDKYWHNELSRRLAVAIFTFLGPEHELTKSFRIKLSRALY